MERAERREVPQNRSVIPAVEQREVRLKEMLEGAERQARAQVLQAEEEARERVEAAREEAPRTVERRCREARAGLAAEVQAEFPEAEAAPRDVKQQAAGRRAEAVKLVLAAVWGRANGR